MENLIIIGIVAIVMLFIGKKIAALKAETKNKELEGAITAARVQFENSEKLRAENAQAYNKEIEKLEHDFQLRYKELKEERDDLRNEKELLNN